MKTLGLAIFLVLFWGNSQAQDILPNIKDGVEALSLTGEYLTSPPPVKMGLEKYEQAKADYDADPMDPENIIWYGRRLAYLGRYRDAIMVFSEGIEKYPEDARMYRHRGHRYITIREFHRAIADLEKATTLIEGHENEIEPDGVPNAWNIPVSSLHGNIWYHLGLAYYLVQDWDKALWAYKNGFNTSQNDDNRVSTTHWIYMILRRMGREPEARQALDVISKDMKIIENMSYHQLCLLYKGDIDIGDLMDANGDNPSNSAVAYGLANWYYYNGQEAKSNKILKDILGGASWSSFGFISAEADMIKR